MYAIRSYYELQKLDCKVFGISRDDAASHVKFKQKFDLVITSYSIHYTKLYDLFGGEVERHRRRGLARRLRLARRRGGRVGGDS